MYCLSLCGIYLFLYISNDRCSNFIINHIVCKISLYLKKGCKKAVMFWVTDILQFCKIIITIETFIMRQIDELTPEATMTEKGELIIKSKIIIG